MHAGVCTCRVHMQDTHAHTRIYTVLVHMQKHVCTHSMHTTVRLASTVLAYSQSALWLSWVPGAQEAKRLQMCHLELPLGPCSASPFYEEILGVLRPLLGLGWSSEHIRPFKSQFLSRQTLIQGGSHPPDPRKAV